MTRPISSQSEVLDMSEEQLTSFMEAVEADAGLKEQVMAAAGDADAVVAIAKAAGFVISTDELRRAQAEVSEDEVGGVSGGGMQRLPEVGCSNNLKFNYYLT